MTPEQRNAIIRAVKAHTRNTKTKEESIKHLKSVGLLTASGKPSSNYYPQTSSK